MKRIIAIDPGDIQSAWVVYDAETKKPLAIGLEPNAVVLKRVSDLAWDCDWPDAGPRPDVEFVIEMIASYGMPVGKTVFDTVYWIGRFSEAVVREGYTPRLMVRRDVKLHLCASARAKDANVNQAIVDRYGGTPQRAKGTKKEPGPLYGFREDIWAAMAVAIAGAETDCRYVTGAAGQEDEAT